MRPGDLSFYELQCHHFNWIKDSTLFHRPADVGGDMCPIGTSRFKQEVSFTTRQMEVLRCGDRLGISRTIPDWDDLVSRTFTKFSTPAWRDWDSTSHMFNIVAGYTWSNDFFGLYWQRRFTIQSLSDRSGFVTVQTSRWCIMCDGRNLGRVLVFVVATRKNKIK